MENINENKKRIRKYKELDEFVSLYLENYYDITELCLHSKYKTPYQVLKDPFFKENYDSEVQKEIREKSLEMKNLQRNYGTNTYKTYVKNGEKIKLMKEKLLITPYQNKLLDILMACIKCHGNIQKTVEYLRKQGFKYSYCYIESSLKANELRDILNEDSILKIEGFLRAEQVLQGAVISSKRELINQILTLFYMYNGKIFKILEECNINYGFLVRTLTDDMVKNKIGEQKYNEILSIINTYDEKKYAFDELNKVKSL